MRELTGRRVGTAGTRYAGCISFLLLALLVGCSGGGTEPYMNPVGTYSLALYDGHALPVVLRVIEDNPTTPGGESIECEDRLEAMAIALNAQGRFTSSSDRRLACNGGTPDDVTHLTESGSYQSEGSGITLSFDEEDGSVTVATGTVGTRSITITKRTTTGESGTVTDPARLDFERTD
jgi:hypothetical protein